MPAAVIVVALALARARTAQERQVLERCAGAPRHDCCCSAGLSGLIVAMAFVPMVVPLEQIRAGRFSWDGRRFSPRSS